MNKEVAAPDPSPVPTLAQMASDVRAARGQVAALRIQPVTQPSLLAARQDLLRLMEVYAGALVAKGLPIPPQLRDDLRLHRDIRRHPGSDWHQRGGPP